MFGETAGLENEGGRWGLSLTQPCHGTARSTARSTHTDVVGVDTHRHRLLLVKRRYEARQDKTRQDGNTVPPGRRYTETAVFRRAKKTKQAGKKTENTGNRQGTIQLNLIQRRNEEKRKVEPRAGGGITVGCRRYGGDDVRWPCRVKADVQSDIFISSVSSVFFYYFMFFQSNDH